MRRHFRHILLTGATGQLGNGILKSGLFKSLFSPSRADLDLCDGSSVKKYFSLHTVDAIIHTAAIARMQEAENDPLKALRTNIMGTSHLVEEVIQAQKKRRKPIRFIYISTDGVYPSTHGRYKETDPTIPYNRYGWTKLGGECAVRLLNDYCILRGRFYDPSSIIFKSFAIDSYSSGVLTQDMIEAVHRLLNSDFIGVINIGSKRMSDYARYKKFNAAAKPCRLNDIQKGLSFAISSDASMDCSQWQKFKDHQ